MEEPKEIKETANQNHWWDTVPIKYEDLQDRADHWTLGADAATATLLQQISSKMIARTHEVEAALKNACEDVDDLHVSLANVTTSFHFLSNTQFTENRTYQEDERSRDMTDKAPIQVMKTPQQDLLSSCKEAITEGLRLVDSSFLKVEISDSESEGGDQQEGLTVYKRINPYDKRKLPHIIGSSAFYADDTLGLYEEAVEDLENENETSSVGSVEVKDALGPIVANSSKLEVDDDSDSDETFLQFKRSSLINEDSSFHAEKISLPRDLSSENTSNLLKSSNSLPMFNGISSDSDEGGPLFGPYPNQLDNTRHTSKNSSTKNQLPGNNEVEQRINVTRDSDSSSSVIPVKSSELPSANSGRMREGKSTLFGSDSDDDGLFSTRRTRVPDFHRTNGTMGEKLFEVVKEGQGKRISPLPNEYEEGQNDNLDRNQNEVFPSEPSSVERKKPVGGINIFNTAITKAIESQQSSGSERLSSSKKSQQTSGSDHIISSKNITTHSALDENRNARVQPGSARLFSEDDNDENSCPVMPSKVVSSHNTKDADSKSFVTVPPNRVPHKSMVPLFSDEEGLFTTPKQATNNHLPPPFPESKSVSRKGDSGKVTSLFSDSDDDLFKPVRQSNSWKTGKTDSQTQGILFEPPPIPHSPNPPSSHPKGKKSITVKKSKALTNIFNSSSSDDEMFSPRRPQAPLPGTKPEYSSKSSSYAGMQSSVLPKVDTATNNSTVEKSRISNPSSESINRVPSVQSHNALTKNVTKPEEGIVVDTTRTVVRNSLSAAPEGKPSISEKKIKSLFGTSDEDENDIFAPKLKAKESGDNSSKGLTITPDAGDSSEKGSFQSVNPTNNVDSADALYKTKDIEKKSSKGLTITPETLYASEKISKVVGPADAPAESTVSISTRNRLHYSSEEDMFENSKSSKITRSCDLPKNTSRSVDVGSSKITSTVAPSDVAHSKIASVPSLNSGSNSVNDINPPNSTALNSVTEVEPLNFSASNLSNDVPASTSPKIGSKKPVNNSSPNVVTAKPNSSNITNTNCPKGSASVAPPKVAPKPVTSATSPKSTSDSSDDDLFKTSRSKDSQKSFSQLSNSNSISNSNQILTSIKSEVVSTVPDSSTLNTELKPTNIFSSDSDEDIFKSSANVGTIKNRVTKSLFSDSDEIDDIFSSDFNKSRKSTLQSSDKLTPRQSDKSILKSSGKSTLQYSDQATLQSSDKSTLQPSDKSIFQSSDELIPRSDKSTIQSSDKPDLLSDKSTRQSSDKSIAQLSETTAQSSDKTILQSIKSTQKSSDTLKINQNTSGISALSNQTEKNPKEKSIKSEDLENWPSESEVSKNLDRNLSDASVVQTSADLENAKTDTFPIPTAKLSVPKKCIFEDDDDDDLFGLLSTESAVLPVGARCTEKNIAVSNDTTDGACVSRVKEYSKNKDKATAVTKPQPVSPTKKPPIGGVPLFGGDKYLSKKPIGGVSLFGGDELLSKLKLRRKSSSSEHEEGESKHEIKNPVEALPIKSSPFARAEKSQSVTPLDDSKTVLRSATSQFSRGVLRSASSPSQEMGVSFDDKKRASAILVSVNKNRPKIHHRRHLPSRSKRGRSVSTGTDHVDGSVEKSVLSSNSDVEVFNDFLIEKLSNTKKMSVKQSLSSPEMTSSTSKVEREKQVLGSAIESINTALKSDAVSNSNVHKFKESKSQNTNITSIIDDLSTKDSIKVKNTEAISSSNLSSAAAVVTTASSSADAKSSKASESFKSTLGAVSVEDIFNEERSKTFLQSETRDLPKQATKKLMSSTSIFDDDDDEDVDDLFNAPKKFESKKAAIESTRDVVKVEKKEAKCTKILSKTSSLFSDDDDGDDRLFSTTKTVTKTISSKVTTGKQAAKHSSLFADDDSDSELFSSGPAKVTLNSIGGANPSSEIMQRNTPHYSTSNPSKKENPSSKEKTFVDPLMGKIS